MGGPRRYANRHERTAILRPQKIPFFSTSGGLLRVGKDMAAVGIMIAANVRFCLGEDLLLWLDSVVKRSVAAP